jgi:tetratricopeptide (TPR) repeat protein
MLLKVNRLSVRGRWPAWALRRCLPIAVLAFIVSFPLASQAQSSDEADLKIAETIRMKSAEAFNNGLKFYSLEQWEKAGQEFEKARKATPNIGAIYYKLAQTEARLKHLTEATALAERAIELDDKNQYFYLYLASLYEQQQAYGKSVKIYQRLLKLRPEDDELNLFLAQAYLRLGKYDEALKVIDKAEKAYGKNEEFTHRKQEIYLQRNQLDKVIEEGQGLIKAFPDEPIYKLQLAEILASNGRLAESRTIIAEVLAMQPGNGEAHLLLFQVLRFEKKDAEAWEELKLVFRNPDLGIDPKVGAFATSDLIRAYNSPAEKAMAMGLVNDLVAVHPTEAKAFSLRGDVMRFAEEPREARRSYIISGNLANTTQAVWEQVVQLDLELEETDSLLKHTNTAVERYPNSGLFWFYNGQALLMQKRPALAAKSLEQVVRLVPENKDMLLEAHATLGDTYQQLKDYEKSDEAYDKALALDPNNIHVLNNYSYFLSLRKKDLDKAKTMSQKLVAAKPKDATYLDTYGWVLYVNKEYQAALVPLAQAAELSQNNGVILEHYGDALYQVGQKEQALAQWKLAKKAGGELTEHIDKKISTRSLHE